MLTTSNYALKKPEGTDVVNIDDFNFNADTIDKTLKGLNDGKANTNHGNHVPTLESANNARFLRNDDTWQTVTPANIGAVPNSTLGSTTIQADSDNSSTSEYVSLKAGGNELKITSSGGGSTPTKSNTSATLNGNALYHVGNKPNKSDVGLSNVDNTSDMSKPISNATQTALNGKASTSHNHTIANVTNLQPNLDAINSNVAQLSNPNLLINGDFQVWQRGTSFINVQQYTSDRWKFINWDNTHNKSAGQLSKTNDGVSLSGAVDQLYIVQPFESDIATSISNKMITLSVELKVSNMTQGSVFIQIGSDSIVRKVIPSSMLNSDYKKFSLTTTLPNNNSKLDVSIGSFNDTALGGIVNSNCVINIKNVKLELGSMATPFTSRSYAEELAMCQRYYEKGYTIFNCLIPNWIVGSLQLVPKRVKPTLNVYSSKKNLGKVGNFTTGNETSGTLTFKMTDDSENNGGCSYNGLHAIMSSINDFTSGNAYSFYWVADSEIY